MNPDFEMAYPTLARTQLAVGRQRDALQVLDRLLQKNPTHPLALQLLRQLRAER